MPVDLMVVDDDECVRRLMQRFAQLSRLQYIDFDSGLKAEDFISKCATQELPLAYLVDMKTTQNFTDVAELNSPLELFRMLDERGRIRRDTKGKPINFVYFTGNISEHDEQVRQATYAQVFCKTADLDSIRAFISGLQR